MLEYANLNRNMRTSLSLPLSCLFLLFGTVIWGSIGSTLLMLHDSTVWCWALILIHRCLALLSQKKILFPPKEEEEKNGCFESPFTLHIHPSLTHSLTGDAPFHSLLLHSGAHIIFSLGCVCVCVCLTVSMLNCDKCVYHRYFDRKKHLILVLTPTVTSSPLFQPTASNNGDQFEFFFSSPPYTHTHVLLYVCEYWNIFGIHFFLLTCVLPFPLSRSHSRRHRRRRLFIR